MWGWRRTARTYALSSDERHALRERLLRLDEELLELARDLAGRPDADLAEDVSGVTIGLHRVRRGLLTATSALVDLDELDEACDTLPREDPTWDE